MSSYENNDFLETAVKAAGLAGEIIANNLGRVSKDDVDVKQASDFVTRVDRDSEQVIIKTIRDRFPHHRFLAEETAKESPDGGQRLYEPDGTYLWIVDPLDGTTNYIHGFPAFSVSIALEYSPRTPAVVRGKGEIILGVIFDPSRKEFFTAEKGKGSFLNGQPISVSTINLLRDCLITTGFPFRRKNLLETYLVLFKNIFHKVSDIRRAGSAALDLAYLASGRCDGFFEVGLSPWDIAAGSILIKEAGGVITDFGGGTDYLSTGNVVAGVPVIHKEILKEVKGVFRGIIDR